MGYDDPSEEEKNAFFAAIAADEKRKLDAHDDLLAALQDMLYGWLYIRKVHGDLYGVGWDRAQGKAETAIAKATGVQP